MVRILRRGLNFQLLTDYICGQVVVSSDFWNGMELIVRLISLSRCLISFEDESIQKIVLYCTIASQCFCTMLL
jgi:hypothetical protein